MSKQIKWREQLQSFYYHVLFELANNNSHHMIAFFIDQLCHFPGINNAAIYLYDERTKSYRVTTPTSQDHLEFLNDEHLIYALEEFTIDETIIQVQQLLSDDEWSNAQIVQLEGKSKPAYLLVQLTEKLTDSELLILKQETENLLQIINRFIEQQEMNLQNQYLNDLSEQMYSVNITDILTGISQSLEGIFPDFTHHLFLVQDVESDHLPIKPIDINQRSSESLRNKALMTGEVQFQVNQHMCRTYLYAPLQGKQGIYGVIELISPRLVFYLEDDIKFMKKIASRAGQAIENAILYQNSTYLVSDLKFLNETVKQLNSNMKIPEILTVLKEQMINICDASEVGFIYFKQDDDKNFTILSESTAFFNSENGVDFSYHLVKKMIEKPEAIFSGDFGLDLDDTFCYRSVMFLPMMQNQTLHGIVAIMHEDMFYFSFENFKLMQSLVGHSTLALINSILNEELEQAVITDYLTKLYSRNYLDEMINYHMELDDRGSLLLFDIDDFKKINDTYGHYVGDQVIKEIAHILQTYVNHEDIPARWGGEEFAVYLPHAHLDEGVQLAEKIRTHIADQLDNPPVTISCGVSFWMKDHDESVEKLFIQADKALYEAKEKGKNSIVKQNV